LADPCSLPAADFFVAAVLSDSKKKWNFCGAMVKSGKMLAKMVP
jgi:hypothetical protein